MKRIKPITSYNMNVLVGKLKRDHGHTKIDSWVISTKIIKHRYKEP